MGRSIDATATVTGDWRGTPPRWGAEARLAPRGDRVFLRLVAARPPPRGAILAVSGDLRRPDPPRNGYDEAALLARTRASAWCSRRSGGARSAGAAAWPACSTDDPAGQRRGVRSRRPRRRGRAARRAGAGRGRGPVAGGPGRLPRLRPGPPARGLGSNVALLAVLVLVLAWVAGWAARRRSGDDPRDRGYVGVVGPSPSVVRAAWRGRSRRRRGCSRGRWIAGTCTRSASRVCSARNPYDALDPGFQLSFAAVAAIYVLAPRLTGWLEGTPLPLVLVVPSRSAPPARW